MTGTLAVALAARKIPTQPNRLSSEIEGIIENVDGKLLVHHSYKLSTLASPISSEENAQQGGADGHRKNRASPSHPFRRFRLVSTFARGLPTLSPRLEELDPSQMFVEMLPVRLVPARKVGTHPHRRRDAAAHQFFHRRSHQTVQDEGGPQGRAGRHPLRASRDVYDRVAIRQPRIQEDVGDFVQVLPAGVAGGMIIGGPRGKVSRSDPDDRHP